MSVLRDLRYSSRSASVGLTFEARHAGMNAAASAPAARSSAAVATVAGSVAVTPNNWDWMSLPRAATQGSHWPAARVHTGEELGGGLVQK